MHRHPHLSTNLLTNLPNRYQTQIQHLPIKTKLTTDRLPKDSPQHEPKLQPILVNRTSRIHIDTNLQPKLTYAHVKTALVQPLKVKYPSQANNLKYKSKNSNPDNTNNIQPIQTLPTFSPRTNIQPTYYTTLQRVDNITPSHRTQIPKNEIVANVVTRMESNHTRPKTASKRITNQPVQADHTTKNTANAESHQQHINNPKPKSSFTPQPQSQPNPKSASYRSKQPCETHQTTHTVTPTQSKSPAPHYPASIADVDRKPDGTRICYKRLGCKRPNSPQTSTQARKSKPLAKPAKSTIPKASNPGWQAPITSQCVTETTITHETLTKSAYYITTFRIDNLHRVPHNQLKLAVKSSNHVQQPTQSRNKGLAQSNPQSQASRQRNPTPTSNKQHQLNQINIQNHKFIQPKYSNHTQTQKGTNLPYHNNRLIQSIRRPTNYMIQSANQLIRHITNFKPERKSQIRKYAPTSKHIWKTNSHQTYTQNAFSTSHNRAEHVTLINYKQR
eukprot:gene2822-1807_t